MSRSHAQNGRQISSSGVAAEFLVHATGSAMSLTSVIICRAFLDRSMRGDIAHICQGTGHGPQMKIMHVYVHKKSFLQHR